MTQTSKPVEDHATLPHDAGQMTDDLLQKLSIPGHVTLEPGEGGLMRARVTTDWSTAEVYLHGAHVTAFQKSGEEPLLFMSELSQFEADKPIRGGVPVIFPWFGGRDGYPSHGFARITAWTLEETTKSADGSISLRFLLPESFSPCRVEYLVTIGEDLTLAMNVANPTEETLSFENCLHTYFSIASIDDVEVAGLKGVTYVDQLDSGVKKQEAGETVIFAEEVDRIYQNPPATLEIHDTAGGRRIVLETTNFHSAVVWNPWIAKAQRMPDFGDDEYLRMVCVESGNVADNRIAIAPNGVSSSSLRVQSLSL